MTYEETRISLNDLAKAKSLDFDFADVGSVDGETVKRVRKKLGLTQYLFAKLIHVSKKTVEKWEEGCNPIKGSNAVLVYLLEENPMLARSLLKIVPHNQEITPKYKTLYGLDDKNDIGL